MTGCRLLLATTRRISSETAELAAANNVNVLHSIDFTDVEMQFKVIAGLYSCTDL